MSELQANTVLRKTEAGINGIKQRDPRLNPKLRMSLILVDGTKSVAELLKSLPNPEEVMQMLTQLLDVMLGPDSEVLCLQIERCTSILQLNGKIIEISRIVAAMRSEKKAAEFLLAATS